MSRRVGLAAVIGLAVGAATSWALRPDPAPRVVEVAGARDAAGTCVATLRPADVFALESSLRDAVRPGDVNAARAPAVRRIEGIGADDPGDLSADAEADAEVAAEAIASADTLVHQAITSGRWTDADVQALRRLVPKLPPAERARVTSALIQAVNARRVTLATRTPL